MKNYESIDIGGNEMKVRTVQKLRDIFLLVGIIIMLCHGIFAPFFVIGGIITLIGFVMHFCYNKCPYCRRQLGRNNGAYCQHCGHALD